LDVIDWKPTAPFGFDAPMEPGVDNGAAANSRAIQSQAIRVLLARGFVYAGEDSVGLPCYRSRSGAILIGVGSCRCLAYAAVQGRLQVVAAARTLALLCRIGPDTPYEPRRAEPAVRGPDTRHSSPRPEPVLVI
jgi:hypothetical protein